MHKYVKGIAVRMGVNHPHSVMANNCTGMFLHTKDRGIVLQVHHMSCLDSRQNAKSKQNPLVWTQYIYIYCVDTGALVELLTASTPHKCYHLIL